MWEHWNTWDIEIGVCFGVSHDDGAAAEVADGSLGPWLKTGLILVADDQVAGSAIVDDLHSCLSDGWEILAGHDFKASSAQGGGNLGESSDYNGAGGCASKCVHNLLYASLVPTGVRALDPT